MKVEKINLSPLYDEEHFQFHTQFANLTRNIPSKY